MIDLATEHLLTLERAAERLMVSKSALYGWITHGSNGIRLEAAKVGGRWRTSEEALQRFSDGLTPNHGSSPSPSPSPRPTTVMSKERERHLKEVDERLDELLGIRKCETCRTEIVAPKGVIPKNHRVWCPKCLVQRRSATLGKRIRTFRWAALLSQAELSRRTGILVEVIRAYEYDEKKPSEAHLAKLVETLGNDLVSGLEPK